MKLLPENPNLTYLHRIGHFDTSMHGLSDEAIFDMNFSINDAQRVTAREYSFSSWARLKLFVQKSSQASDEFDAELSATILKRKARYDGLLKMLLVAMRLMPVFISPAGTHTTVTFSCKPLT